MALTTLRRTYSTSAHRLLLQAYGSTLAMCQERESSDHIKRGTPETPGLVAESHCSPETGRTAGALPGPQAPGAAL